MTAKKTYHVYLSYNENTLDFVEQLATRLRGDSRLSFWFEPWHGIPGIPSQEQMEDALQNAQSCAVFFDGTDEIEGWQNEQMRIAIQTRVEDEPGYRIIPVILPGVERKNLPGFLRRYQAVHFRHPSDEQALNQLVAGILGIPPIQVDEFAKIQADKIRLPRPTTHVFSQGHALIIGVASYAMVDALPETTLNDARDISSVLTDLAACGYPEANVTLLLDDEAVGENIRLALAQLAIKTPEEGTAIVYFSGHGAHESDASAQQYILPFDCKPNDLTGTAIAGDEMTAMLNSIQAARLLVIFDCCHSGGVGDPKALLDLVGKGFSDEYYQALAQGIGRVVMASSRPDELSWALHGMRNSLFTHYLLDALRGNAKTENDGYVRVFDTFRHLAAHVPDKAAALGISQHPVFKATAMETDFPIALTPAKMNGN